MARHSVSSSALVCTLLAFALPAPASVVHCPPEADGWVTRGWRAYRADSITVAASRFARALRVCPASLDARVGLGYSKLRLGEPAAAESLFTSALAVDSTDVDAWQGLMRAAHRK